MTYKTENANGTYGVLSRGLHQAYINGEWDRASEILRLMACVLEIEKKYTDELKALMLSFYIDLSGIQRMPFTNDDTVESAREAYKKSGMTEADVSFLYFDSIRKDTMPRHSLTVEGSFRVFMYCLLGKRRKLEVVLRNLGK